MTLKNNLEWLESWYTSQCDGDWEHMYGITIKTVDNPGWYITINLTGTECEKSYFSQLDYDEDEMNWYFCLVRNGNFEACSAIDMWEKIREISPDLQTVCLKDAKKTIRKAKNLKKALCNYHLNSTLGTFVEDISLLCEYVEEVLDLQCSFFSSPDEFIENDSLKRLIECMTKLNAQSAYIQEVY